MHRRRLLALALSALVLAAVPACGASPKPDARSTRSSSADATSSPQSSTAPKGSSPSAVRRPKPSAAVPAHPLTSGPVTRRCARGWTAPERGTALRSFPLDLLRRSQNFTGEFLVHDLRYFKGPDDRNSAGGSEAPIVERWYGKVTSTEDPSFRLRFLVRRTPVGSGIAGIAPFDTKDYAMADWRGFDGEGGASTFPGLPGSWPGQPTDLAADGGLPAEVVGCIAE